ncbi:MAG: tetratricopeptide repeat protein [Akkermansia sp.]
MHHESNPIGSPQQAEEQDKVYDCYLEGLAYLHGKGKAKNGKLAMQCFHEAAEEGLVNALYELGRCHLSDTLDIHHPKKGFALILESAQVGFALAQYEAGLCYKNGSGTKRNLKQALRWLSLAQQQGVKEAASELVQIQGWIDHPETIPVPPPDDGMRDYVIARAQGQESIKFHGKRLHYDRWKDSDHWAATS